MVQDLQQKIASAAKETTINRKVYKSSYGRLKYLVKQKATSKEHIWNRNLTGTLWMNLKAYIHKDNNRKVTKQCAKLTLLRADCEKKIFGGKLVESVRAHWTIKLSYSTCRIISCLLWACVSFPVLKQVFWKGKDLLRCYGLKLEEISRILPLQKVEWCHCAHKIEAFGKR